MTLDFDLSDLRTVEFGVGRDMNAERAFHCIPVDVSVQDALREMAEATWQALSTMEPAQSLMYCDFLPALKRAGLPAS